MGAEAPRVVVRRSARRTRTVTAYRERDSIVVLMPEHLSRADEDRLVADLVAKVLRREATRSAPATDEALTARAVDLAARFLDPYVGATVSPTSVVWATNQNHRWGSCTPATRAIRLSHRLRPMPGWVVDSVLLHELAHLVEPTHSDAFSALVDRFPQAERARGFLEGYQAALGQSPQGADVG